MIYDLMKKGDKLYEVKRRVPHHNFTNLKKDPNPNLELVAGFRDYLGCNHVLRDQTHFIFVEEIEEATIIAE